MSEQIAWGRLTQQGRVKAPGIYWTDEEMEARYKKGMSADEVRAGILDPKDRGKIKVETKKDLVKQAKEAGVEFNEEVVSEGDLKKEIESKQKPAGVKVEDMKWNDLRAMAKEKGVYKAGQKKADVIKALKEL